VANVSIGGLNTYIACTHVTLSYPYHWQFNRVITLLVPRANYVSLTQITTDAVMQNLS
jgi:hypothetical protein